MLLLFQASASEKKHAKFCFVFALLLFIGGTTVYARPPKLFRVTLKTVDGERIQGILYDVTDSTILYVANKRDQIRAMQADTASALSVPLSTIKQLKIIRRGHGWRGALIGLAIGTATGLIMNASIPINPSKGLGSAIDNAVRGMAISSAFLSGPIYGALFSNIPRRNLLFRGDTTFVPNTKTDLLRYAYRPRQANQ